MAPSPPTSARLTGAGAIGAAVVLAAFTPAGPWQPVSVFLGWAAVVAVLVSVGVGKPAGLAAGSVLFVIRAGVHGLAGDRTPGLVLTGVLLALMVELAAVSFDLRVMPLSPLRAAARAAAVAVGAGFVVAISVTGLSRGAGVGPVAGLAVAFGATLALTWLWTRDPGSGAEGVVE